MDAIDYWTVNAEESFSIAKEIFYEGDRGSAGQQGTEPVLRATVGYLLTHPDRLAVLVSATRTSR